MMVLSLHHYSVKDKSEGNTSAKNFEGVRIREEYSPTIVPTIATADGGDEPLLGLRVHHECYSVRGVLGSEIDRYRLLKQYVHCTVTIFSVKVKTCFLQQVN